MDGAQWNTRPGCPNGKHFIRRSRLVVERQPSLFTRRRSMVSRAAPAERCRSLPPLQFSFHRGHQTEPAAAMEHLGPWLLRLAGESAATATATDRGAATSAESPCAHSRGWTGRGCVCRVHAQRSLRHRHGFTPAANQDRPATLERIPALPPGCCASRSALPGLADLRETARPRRLPALPSSAKFRVQLQLAQGARTTLARLLYAGRPIPPQPAARARRPTGMQVKAAHMAS